MSVDRRDARDTPSSPSRLKKKLLRGAVDENVRTIRNEPPGDLYRRARPRWALVAAAIALAIATAALWLAVQRIEAANAAASPRPPGAPLDPAVDPIAGPVRISSQVFPLAVHKIVIDPGHGGTDLGTSTPSGVLEKELTLDIAKRLHERLAAAGFDSALTRDTDRRLLLRERARFANERQADLFVSIHLNWLEHDRLNRGVETYYLGPTDDPFVTRLARAENSESGYAIADVRRLLDSIYSDLRQEQSKAFAMAVQKRLVRSVSEISSEVRDRGVKSAPFLVLVATDMPAILAEVASLSSADEAQLLDSAEYRDRIAVALFDGIRAYSRSVARTGSVAANPAEAR